MAGDNTNIKVLTAGVTERDVMSFSTNTTTGTVVTGSDSRGTYHVQINNPNIPYGYYTGSAWCELWAYEAEAAQSFMLRGTDITNTQQVDDIEYVKWASALGTGDYIWYKLVMSNSGRMENGEYYTYQFNITYW
jgi:hypothetical protein